MVKFIQNIGQLSTKYNSVDSTVIKYFFQVDIVVQGMVCSAVSVIFMRGCNNMAQILRMLH